MNLAVLLTYKLVVLIWWYCSEDLNKKLGLLRFCACFKSCSATYVFLAIGFKITEIFLKNKEMIETSRFYCELDLLSCVPVGLRTTTTRRTHLVRFLQHPLRCPNYSLYCCHLNKPTITRKPLPLDRERKFMSLLGKLRGD